MAMPFFTIALAAAESADPTQTGIAEILLRALVFSTVVGAAAGGGTGWLLAKAQAHGWVDDAWARIGVVAVAIGANGLAVAIDGSGFISAWVAGLAFGAAIRVSGGGGGGGGGGGAAVALGGGVFLGGWAAGFASGAAFGVGGGEVAAEPSGGFAEDLG